MTRLVRASALLWAMGPGCAAGQSDDGPSWGPPTVVDDGAGDDDEPEPPEPEEGDDEGGETGLDTGEPGFDDANDSGDGAPAPEPPPNEPPPADDDGAEPPPPGDDGAEPPPPADDGGLPPPGDLDAQCQQYCGALQACGFVADAAEAMQCMADCTVTEGPACDAAWSNVMSCVASLDCFQMQIWALGFPGYPCEAEEQAYATC